MYNTYKKYLNWFYSNRTAHTSHNGATGPLALSPVEAEPNPGSADASTETSASSDVWENRSNRQLAAWKLAPCGLNGANGELAQSAATEV